MNVHTSVTLENAVVMPTFGLGVYDMAPEITKQAVLAALETGYRLIDTASFYGNEREVGAAIRESGIPRKEIFVTTKLWPTGFLNVEHAFNESNEKLGLDYIDLYLIHWPFPGKDRAWKKMEKLCERGEVKAIGVSNYKISDLEHLQEFAQMKPFVNQVEFSPFMYRRELLEYCTKHGIVLEAYSPLTRGRRMNDNRIAEIAVRHNKTVAQVMIRWGLQHGAIEIPKSSNRERIKENFAVYDFELSDEDMAALDALNENYHASFLSRTQK